jgi:hypothetical protein
MCRPMTENWGPVTKFSTEESDETIALELVVYPAVSEIWKWHFGLKRERRQSAPVLPAIAGEQV